MHDAVLEIVERSNQRGGRMLSILDLIEAGTLSEAQAAWLLARIADDGASWFVGAKPGGAGKTTIMSALLTMLPPGIALHLARRGTGWERSLSGDCVVAYEIGPGPFEAYVWGEDLRHLAHLAERGCRIVTNMHADTLDEARDQIVGQNGVPEEYFTRFGLFLPITLEGNAMRRQPRVKEIFAPGSNGEWIRVGENPDLGSAEQGIAAFLREAADERLRTIEEVREAWLVWLAARRRKGGT